MADFAAVATAVLAISKNKVGVENEKMAIKHAKEKSKVSLQLFHFNISGQKFIVSNQLIKSYPHSKFASPQLLADHWIEELNAFYFDRDPALFNAVLNILRYNVLNVPSGYNKELVMEEINFWNIPSDGINGIQDDEESRLEAEFQWLENRIPPPPPGSNKFLELRYKCWCFITDPIGPYTKFRRLSVMYAVITIASVFLYLIIHGLGTSVYYRQPNPEKETRSFVRNLTGDMEQAIEDIGCSGMKKIDCYVHSSPKPWIITAKKVFMTFFVFETSLRLILCPGLIYFKSFINWMDIFSGLCAISSFALTSISNSYDFDQHYEKEIHRVLMIFQSLQVLRIFKIFQFASFVDGLMIIILTLKACLKELTIMVLYLVIAMFLFATTISFVELQSDTGAGIPDCIYGYWWAIITMTTVGYGDFYPTTVVGYIIGVMCSITGIILTALPVAVIGSNFNVYWEHNKRRRQLLMAALKRESEGEKEDREIHDSHENVQLDIEYLQL